MLIILLLNSGDIKTKTLTKRRAIRTIRVANSKVKELAYKTLVRPKSNTHPQSGLLTEKNIKKIEMIQRRAARWVTGNFSSYDSVSNMLCELGWRYWQIDGLMLA